MQQTIRNSINARGRGEYCHGSLQLSVHPGEENSGIIFRVDGEDIKANLTNARAECGLSLCNSRIEVKSTAMILAALYGLGIDNAVIELSAPEVPLMDGSAGPFVFLLQAAGIHQQSMCRQTLIVNESLVLRQQESWARLLPSHSLRLACLVKGSSEFDQQALRDVVADVSDAFFLSQLCHAGAKRLRYTSSRSGEKGGMLDRVDVLNALADLSLLGVRLQGTYVGCGINRSLNLSLLRRLIAQQSAWTTAAPLTESMESFEPERSRRVSEG
jgi:UDP-3-O-[3-hydroxymyristoyl] N-acetylglucosamine deacetylase